MQIELTRFEVWGRTLGFLDEKTGKERSNDKDSTILVLDLADVLQIEAARKLVHDILTSPRKILENFKEVATRYRLDPARRSLDGTQNSRKFDAQLRRAWASTKDLGLHLVLKMKDKDTMRNLLQTLTDLNDGLEKVLSVAQKGQAGEILDFPGFGQIPRANGTG